MELGNWAFITAPSLLALIPLAIYIIMMFMGKDNVSGLIIGIAVGAVMLGLDLRALSKAFQAALGTTTALLGVIIMTGAGLGVLMTEARVTHTLVYWIVKRVGVATPTRGKLVLVVCSILICGMLGTLGGGNAVIAPIMLPILASLGVTPSVVTILFKVSGEIGLILGPLTGVTLVTMEVTGLNYGQLLIYATLPFSAIWLLGSWVAANRAQKRTEGKESYDLDKEVSNIDAIVVTPEEKRSTIAFLVAFLALVGYGIISKQGTNYALIVMIVLSFVVAISKRMEIDHVINSMVKGMSSMTNLFVVFITIEVLLTMVDVGGGFQAISSLLGGMVKEAGAASVMLVASVVGGFGIEAAAVAEIRIITEMFGGLAQEVGLPMSCFAVALLAATRLTGSIYPTSNLAGQMGIAHCKNMKEVLVANWISAAFVWVYILIWAFVGPAILS